MINETHHVYTDQEINSYVQNKSQDDSEPEEIAKADSVCVLRLMLQIHQK